jgi:hypothetical protein
MAMDCCGLSIISRVPNEGLVIAEVELADPMQRIDLPAWIGEEITLDGRYGNSSLALRPIRALALEPDLVREPA